MKFARSFLVLLLFTTLLPPDLNAEAPCNITLRYAEKTARKKTVKTYCISKKDKGLVIRIDEGDVQREIVCSASCDTTLERYRNTGSGDRLDIVRKQNDLIFDGTLQSSPVSKTVGIDHNRWYGSKLLLRNFVLSSSTAEVFYMTSPERCRTVKLRAKKEGQEDIAVNGQVQRAVRVVFTLPKIRYRVWKSVFWYRATDGILLKAEEMRGPPWKAKTIVELIQETPNRTP